MNLFASNILRGQMFASVSTIYLRYFSLFSEFFIHWYTLHFFVVFILLQSGAAQLKRASDFHTARYNDAFFRFMFFPWSFFSSVSSPFSIIFFFDDLIIIAYPRLAEKMKGCCEEECIHWVIAQWCTRQIIVRNLSISKTDNCQKSVNFKDR